MANEERTVLVTGANSGIGLATVIEAARRGFDAVGSVRSPQKARAVRDRASEAGVDVRTVLLDVTDADACARVVDRLKPWGLVNNAGTSFTGAVEDVDDDEARQAIETMLLAPARLARLAVRHMREAGGGRIVNVSSIYGRTSTALTGWYQAAKQGLEGVSDALRLEVASDGIDVVLVQPGGIGTALWDVAELDLTKREGSRYEDAYRRALQGIKLASPLLADARRVATTIVRALTTRRPLPRYLVGIDARLAALLETVTPTVIADRVKRLPLGL